MRASAHRDYTKLPGTIDSGRFVKEDEMMRALTPSVGPLVGGLSSRSTRDARLRASESPTIRSKVPVGLCTGRAQSADPAKPVKYSSNAARHAALRAAKRGIVRPNI